MGISAQNESSVPSPLVPVMSRHTRIGGERGGQRGAVESDGGRACSSGDICDSGWTPWEKNVTGDQVVPHFEEPRRTWIPLILMINFISPFAKRPSTPQSGRLHRSASTNGCSAVDNVERALAVIPNSIAVETADSWDRTHDQIAAEIPSRPAAGSHRISRTGLRAGVPECPVVHSPAGHSTQHLALLIGARVRHGELDAPAVDDGRAGDAEHGERIIAPAPAGDDELQVVTLLGRSSTSGGRHRPDRRRADRRSCPRGLPGCQRRRP